MISTFVFMRAYHPTLKQYKKFKKSIDSRSLLKGVESVIYYGATLSRSFSKNGFPIKTECVHIFMESLNPNSFWTRTNSNLSSEDIRLKMPATNTKNTQMENL